MRKVKYLDGNLIEYEILKLVDSYDPILRRPTQWVDFDIMRGEEVAYCSMSLMETLNHLRGLGLSANQVGLPWRIFALNMGDKIWSLINPRVLDKSLTKTKYNEGCLSFPGLYLEVGRASSITIEFQAANGEKKIQTFDGLTATCVQHEMDHLDGICYTDLVSPIKLQKAKDKARLHKRKVRRWAEKQAQLSN